MIDIMSNNGQEKDKRLTLVNTPMYFTYWKIKLIKKLSNKKKLENKPEILNSTK